MNNTEFNLEGVFLIDLINDHIRRKYVFESNKLTDECNALNEKIDALEEQEFRGLKYEKRLTNLKKIVKPFVVGMMITAIISNFLYAFIIKYPFFTLFFLSLTAGANIGYIIAEKKLKELVTNERENFDREISLHNEELKKKTDELEHVKKIIKSIGQAKDCLKSYAPQYLIKKKFAEEYKKIFLEYLERDISLLSLLVFADNGRLPKKSPSEMTDDELNNIMQLLRDMDKKISTNPELFLENELKGIQNFSADTISEKTTSSFSEGNSYVDNETDWVVRFKPVRSGLPVSEPEGIATFESPKSGRRRRR